MVCDGILKIAPSQGYWKVLKWQVLVVVMVLEWGYLDVWMVLKRLLYLCMGKM